MMAKVDLNGTAGGVMESGWMCEREAEEDSGGELLTDDTDAMESKGN